MLGIAGDDLNRCADWDALGGSLGDPADCNPRGDCVVGRDLAFDGTECTASVFCNAVGSDDCFWDCRETVAGTVLSALVLASSIEV